MNREPTNYFRRTVGLILCLSPIALLLFSFVLGIYQHSERAGYGFGLIAVAMTIALLNFHLSFTRPILYKMWRGSMEGYRHISSIPLIGTLLIIAGGIVGFGEVITAIAGMGVMLVDTGGSVWFVLRSWKDTSFWDV